MRNGRYLKCRQCGSRYDGSGVEAQLLEKYHVCSRECYDKLSEVKLRDPNGLSAIARKAKAAGLSYGMYLYNLGHEEYKPDRSKPERSVKAPAPAAAPERLYELTCLNCGKEFVYHSPRIKYCGDECRLDVRRKVGLKYYSEQKAGIVTERKRTMDPNGYDRTCRACGKQFVSAHFNALYCGDECRENTTLELRRLAALRRKQAAIRVIEGGDLDEIQAD